MLARAAAVWLAILALAFVNGAVREFWIVPAAGDLPGHAISTVLLCAAIAMASWLTIRWIAPAQPRDAWTVGAAWVALTLAFEFLAGHYLFGNPWNRLLADYNVLRGRIWVLVLVTTLVSPAIAAHRRHLATRGRP